MERKAVIEMSDLIADITHEFSRHKSLADRAIAGLSDEQFFHRPAAQVNSIALIIKHIGGNLLSRFTEFLTTDGEKPTRNRDGEFVLEPADTRENLLQSWEAGWSVLFQALASLTDGDLDKTVIIRGEPHRVPQALLRSLDHIAYHTGQILYLSRLANPDGQWLTVPPGQSKHIRGGYLQPPAH